MLDVITLTCPNCGGKLQVSKDLERFACGYCGNEHVVKRSGGLVSLAPVVDSLVKIEAGVDKTASELAIRRLREDVSNLNKKLDSINERYTSKVIYGIIIAIVGGLAAFSIFFDSGFGVLAFGIMCLIIGGSMINNGMKRTSEERKLEQTLKERKAELKHHQNIVK